MVRLLLRAGVKTNIITLSTLRLAPSGVVAKRMVLRLPTAVASAAPSSRPSRHWLSEKNGEDKRVGGGSSPFTTWLRQSLSRIPPQSPRTLCLSRAQPFKSDSLPTCCLAFRRLPTLRAELGLELWHVLPPVIWCVVCVSNLINYAESRDKKDIIRRIPRRSRIEVKEKRYV